MTTSMGAMSEAVTVLRRFRRSVRVDTDLGVAGSDGFICTSTVEQAIQTTIDHVSELGHGAFTWTGPYGCGKSSLAVVLAATLGPAGKARNRALATLPAALRDGIVAKMRWRRPGWKIVPAVGRRADAREVIAAALDAQGLAGDGDVIRRLLDAGTSGGPGLLLIIDEMGKLLEHAAAGLADAYFFQELAEAATRSEGRLVVIGVLHQAFDDYAYRLARETRDDWLKIQGRYVDVPLNPAGEEQIELLARAFDAPDRPAALEPAVAVAGALRGNGAPRDRVAETLTACWPLNPVVACLLGPLSRRRFGQNQRSLFGFLGSAEPYGFQDFLKSTGLGSGQLYDTSWLWSYLRANLEPSILASPDGHRWSLAIDAVERCEGRGADDVQLRVAKTIALVDMFRERSGLVADGVIVAAAMPDVDPVAVADAIETLKSWSVVVYRRHLGAFSLYAGSDFDIDAAIETVQAEMIGCDYARLRGTGVFSPILAKRHYHHSGAMRWFDVDIASLDDAQERIDRFKGEKGAVGLFLLLVNEGGANAPAVRRRLARIEESVGDRPIAFGVATDSYMLRELSLELIALEQVQSSRPELKGDPVARREVGSRLARLAAELEDRLRNSLARTAWRTPFVSDEDAVAATAEGAARLSVLASLMATALFPRAPRILNELVNRAKPSSNAMAAVRALMVAMVQRGSEPRLGITGFPAEGGLYTSILERTGLHAGRGDGVYGFVPPGAHDGETYRLHPLWEVATRLVDEAGPEGCTLADLFGQWRARPYGLKDGLHPILGLAFLLSQENEISVYLDGVFCSSLGDLLVDRMLQDPAALRVRKSVVSDAHAQILRGVANLTAELSGIEPENAIEPLAVGRRLVALVTGAPGWVRRTTRLGPIASKVRDIAATAHDPNKFMLDDLPALFGREADDDRHLENVVAELKAGLRELSLAYDAMFMSLRDVLVDELRAGRPDTDWSRLQLRARVVIGLTGNYRLDAFATRLSTFDGSIETLEGLASLAANKPPRDWVDRDVDAARVELAALSQEFLRAEGFAHVKGREDGRVRMALFISDPGRPALLTPEFSVDDLDRQRARQLAAKLYKLIGNEVTRDVALAAVVELGAILNDEPPVRDGPVRTAANAR
ncbi:MAG: ATP-binding protein [Aurantimonas endophytica]|uniref:ATP-binding protein n=1 Tax=Aurantimonas endophytica TaxID=1522175 RepID=UPI0030011685